jgi:tetratricopeptide (TPR) repeat protein
MCEKAGAAMTRHRPCVQALIAFALTCSVSWAQQNADPLAAARTLLSSGKIPDAERMVRDYLGTHASSADGHFLLGYVYFREQKPRESLAEFTAGARFRRPAADDFKVIASDYVLLGDFADADRWFSEATREKPEDADAWYLLGRAQYNENHFAAALASFEQVLKLRPDDVEAENNLGLARQGLNDAQGAMQAWQTAIQWEDGHPDDAQPFLNCGALLADQNKPDAALPLLRQAAALAPRNPKIHEELGRVLEMQNKLHDAQSELEEAATLAPNASGLHFKLGRIYQREGLRDQAQQQFSICQKLNSTHSSTETPNPFTR